MNKLKILRQYLDFIYEYEYSLYHDPLLRIPETKENLQYFQNRPIKIRKLKIIKPKIP